MIFSTRSYGNKKGEAPVTGASPGKHHLNAVQFMIFQSGPSGRSSTEIPRLYGFISRSEKKIYIDFFNTELKGNVGTFGASYFVDSINFYPWSDGSVSVEMSFKENIFADLFYLETPGRLVLDVKGSSIL